MNHKTFIHSAGIALCAIVLSSGALAASLVQVKTFKLDGVKGRIDHLAYDSVKQRLFVAALGNNTVEVVDTKTGKRIESIKGQQEPQGIKFLQDANTLVVAAGSGGTIDFYDGNTLENKKHVSGYDDADNIRYDSLNKQVILAWGDGALTWFSMDGVPKSSIKLAGHPESFQLDSARRQLYVNVPDQHEIISIDTTRSKIKAKWSTKKAAANFAMCLSPEGSHIFVACRQSPQIITYDSSSGSELSRVETSGDADDLFYDAKTNRLYESCGEGFIDVFKDKQNGKLERVDRITTSPGARTCLFLDEQRELYLAVPAKGKQECEIRVYKID